MRDRIGIVKNEQDNTRKWRSGRDSNPWTVNPFSYTKTPISYLALSSLWSIDFHTPLPNFPTACFMNMKHWPSWMWFKPSFWIYLTSVLKLFLGLYRWAFLQSGAHAFFETGPFSFFFFLSFWANIYRTNFVIFCFHLLSITEKLANEFWIFESLPLSNSQ